MSIDPNQVLMEVAVGVIVACCMKLLNTAGELLNAGLKQAWHRLARYACRLRRSSMN